MKHGFTDHVSFNLMKILKLFSLHILKEFAVFLWRYVNNLSWMVRKKYPIVILGHNNKNLCKVALQPSLIVITLSRTKTGKIYDILYVFYQTILLPSHFEINFCHIYPKPNFWEISSSAAGESSSLWTIGQSTSALNSEVYIV